MHLKKKTGASEVKKKLALLWRKDHTLHRIESVFIFSRLAVSETRCRTRWKSRRSSWSFWKAGGSFLRGFREDDRRPWSRTRKATWIWFGSSYAGGLRKFHMRAFRHFCLFFFQYLHRSIRFQDERVQFFNIWVWCGTCIYHLRRASIWHQICSQQNSPRFLEEMCY